VNGIYEDIDSECSTRLDADVSGVGVRVSIWAQIGMLILISITEFFHVEDTGIKDIGGGLVLTHFSLEIALIVRLCKRTLTSVDAAIGATILDAQNIALHVPVTAKQTLAARWQVILLVLAQIFGLALLPVLVVKLNRGDFASDDCKCLYIFWWSRLSDCGTFPRGELSVFWIYYSVRCIMWVQSCFYAMYNAHWFHVAEKNGRIPMPNLEEIQELRMELKSSSSEPRSSYLRAEISRLEAIDEENEQQDPGRIVERATIQSGFLYREYPATISLSYMTCALYSLTSMVVAEVTIHEFNLQPSSGVYSIGQIIAIVVSGATILRAIWSFQCLFNEEDNRAFPDLVFNLLWGEWTCCSCLSEGDNENSNQDNQDAGKDQNRSSTESHHSDFQGKSLKTSSESSQSKPGSRMQPTQAGQVPFERVQPNTNIAPTNHGSTETPAASSSLEQGHSSPIIKQDRCERTRHQKRPRDPIYRFTFRQPFHLDAARKIYFPSFSRYWENRSKSKEAAVRHNNVDQSLKHRASAPIQKTDSMRLDDMSMKHGSVPLDVTAVQDEDFLQSSTPEAQQQLSIFGRDSDPTDTSSKIDLQQIMPLSSHSFALRRQDRWNSWTAPRSSYYIVDTHFTLGRIAEDRDVFERMRNKEQTIFIPEQHILDDSEHMKDSIERSLSSRSGYQLRPMFPDSAIRAAHSKVRARSESSTISAIVDDLDIKVKMFDPNDPSVRDLIIEQLQTTAGMKWTERVITPGFSGEPLYMITGIASVANIVTKQAVSHQLVASKLPTRKLPTRIAETISVKGKGTQWPVNPADYREVVAYRVHEIYHDRLNRESPFKAAELPSSYPFFL
jgi:hypothetical protein